METWKPVVGYGGRYEVSDLGMVRSTGRFGTSGCMISPGERSGGYLQVGLHNEEGRKFLYVHRIALESFAGVCPDGYEGSHVNGIPSDNRMENLRWESHLNNEARKLEHGTKMRGERHHSAKLTEIDVQFIRHWLRKKYQHWLIATRFGVRKSTISNISSGRSWSWLPGAQ